MTYPCDLVAERLAAGEPLDAEATTHVGGCVDCARLAEVPALLAAVAREPAPGAGFSVRMQVGARKRLVVRRRRRVALTSAAAVAVLAGGTFAVTREPDPRFDPAATRSLAEQEPEPRPPPAEERPAAGDADQVALDLIRVADVDRALAPQADWDEITHSLVPYRALLARQAARQGADR